MVELSDKQFEKIDKVMDSLIEIRTVLLGAPSEEDGGICGDVKYLKQDHSKLKRNFYALIALLIGLGVIGGSIWGIFR
jgi:hypothetical protein